MYFEQNILKGKHFSMQSKERVQGIMISIYIYMAITIIGLDAYESYITEHDTMFMVELATIIILFTAFLFFPKRISTKTMIYFSLITLSILLFSSFYIIDYNAELTLFWIASLPVFIFYFLGTKEGTVWSILIAFALLFIAIGSWYGIETVFKDTFLLFQVFIGFVVMSYGVYKIEKERSINADRLSEALKEKEILFKEVHHRTKNNMQVMMGLLEIQSFKIDNPKYKKMFHAHVDRIKSMSLVHENLYKGAAFDEVDMHKYLEGILSNLQKVTQHAIITDIDYVTLGIKDSMSLGLIVNEAVNNAIEHAYSAGSNHIDVILQKKDRQYVLSIKDYGLGFNTKREYPSLGMTLIEDLAVSLPNGSLSITIENGTLIEVYFDVKGTI